MLYLLIALSVVATEPVATFSYEPWARVLERFVDEGGRVDYAALARDRADLDRFLASIREVGPRSTPTRFPERDQRLAYYLNAYNALVFEGVLDLGPDVDSVWGLGTGYAFFVRRDVHLDGMETNLKKLEDEVIREGFEEPRVHAALNCASIGCPRLPRKPFLSDRLDDQLESALTEMVGDPRHFRVDPDGKTVRLSQIFDWFREDFIGAGVPRGERDAALLGALNRFRKAGEKLPVDTRVEFLPYEKGLNAQ